MIFDKVITKILTAIFVTFSITGCGFGGEPSEAALAIVNKVYEATNENVRLIGRTTYQDDALWCAFSGTGIEFSFTGTKAEITLGGDNASLTANNTDNYARVAIYLNGKRVVDDMLDQSEKTYTIFETTVPCNAKIRVVKLSETAMSTFSVKEISVNTDGDIKPTEEKEHYIEFIGDSITCGYGVDDENRNHHFSTTTEDITKTYAYKTAEQLNADYSMVSISGYGIISGYSDGKTKQASQVIPKYYDKIGYSYANSLMASTSWDFKANRSPDVVVINLGTNDDSYCKNYEDRQKEYVTEYINFLKTIRKNNPKATIICTLGIMGNNLYKCVEEAVTTYSKKTKDKNVYSMAFEVQSANDGYAADWHPTEATHTKAADKLTDKIEELMKW